MKRLSILVFSIFLNLDYSLAANEVIQVRMSKSEATEFCKVWFAALVRGDRPVESSVQALLAEFYSDDITLIDPNFPQPLLGKSAVAGYYRIILNSYPNWKFEIRDIYPTERGFVLYYEGHVPGVVEKFLGSDILEFDEKGKITKLIEFYDRQPFIEAAKQGSTPRNQENP